MVEGGATVAAAFHRAGLVDRYVLYLAPALFGGDDGRALFAGPGAPSIDDVWRGRMVSVDRLGDDLRIDLARSGLMFTGIVEELGTVVGHAMAAGCASAPPRARRRRASATSIAVNGCCLTVVGLGRRRAGGRPTWSTRRSPAPPRRARPGDP